MKKSLVLLTAVTLLLSACQTTETKEPDLKEVITPVSDESATSIIEETSREALITLSGGDDMKFSLAKIKVKEGQIVKLILKHTGEAPKETMGHNFVLLAAGTPLEKFAIEALNAKDNDYIPVSMKNDVIAHTKTIGGGETDTIEFTAPGKGVYDFLCSFPGHAALMKGTFIVE